MLRKYDGVVRFLRHDRHPNAFWRGQTDHILLLCTSFFFALLFQLLRGRLCWRLGGRQGRGCCIARSWRARTISQRLRFVGIMTISQPTVHTGLNRKYRAFLCRLWNARSRACRAGTSSLLPPLTLSMLQRALGHLPQLSCSYFRRLFHSRLFWLCCDCCLREPGRGSLVSRRCCCCGGLVRLFLSHNARGSVHIMHARYVSRKRTVSYVSCGMTDTPTPSGGGKLTTSCSSAPASSSPCSFNSCAADCAGASAAGKGAGAASPEAGEPAQLVRGCVLLAS